MVRKLSVAATLFVVACLSSGSLLAAEEAPTFAKDVATLVFSKCTSCHREGEAAPFPLTTFEEVRRKARQIALVTEKRIMPPWKPAAAPGTFKHDRSLTDEEIAIFRRWTDAGAPEGDVADLPPLPEYPSGWHLGEPDLILSLATPYEVPAEGEDIYVHFVLPTGLKKDKYVRAVQVRPSNPRVAHHGVILLDGSGTARKLAAEEGPPADRYRNGGDPGFITRGMLPGYAPGQMTREPEADAAGVGLTLAKGLDLVLQMHYHPTGKPESDQPQVGLYFTDVKPKRGPNVIGMANNDIDIPPGEKAFVRQDEFRLPADFEVRTIWGHMHLIGSQTRVWAALPSGETKELLVIPDWDFNWQDSYAYAEPFVLPAGTVVHAEWTWDNSSENLQNPFSPPQRIVWGPDSDDEMSGLIIGGVTVHPGWADGLTWLHVLGHYLDVEKRAKQAQAKRERESARVSAGEE